MKQLITNPYSFSKYTLERDSQGRAVVPAKVMKAGRLKYQTPSGKVFYGNISLDSLKNAAKTANLKPITIKHPPGLLKPSDVTKYQEGISASDFKVEEIDGEQWLVGSLVLQSEKAIQTAESGEIGISAGYLRNIENIENIDFRDDVEFNPDINHIAIACQNPRAKGASISLDEAEDDSARIYSFANQQKPKKKEVIMKQKLIAVKVGDFSMDEASIEYDEEGTGTEQAIAKFQDRETKLVSSLEGMRESMDSMETDHKKEVGDLTGENKGFKSRIEELEKEKENMISLDDIDAMVSERAAIQNDLDSRGIKDEFKTVLDGKKLVVNHDFPNESFDDSEIDGAYKTRNLNDGDLKEQLKSKNAIKKLKDGSHSLDSGDSVSFSQISVSALKKNRDRLKRRA